MPFIAFECHSFQIEIVFLCAISKYPLQPSLGDAFGV